MIFAVLFLSFSVSYLREDEVIDSLNDDEDTETDLDVNAENISNHCTTSDYTWNSSDEIPIVLNDNSITASGTGTTVDGSKVTITSAGTITIDAADDAIHTDGNMEIYNGTFYIASGDDGMHSEYNTEFTTGNIYITDSYEGLESAMGSITINGGNLILLPATTE